MLCCLKHVYIHTSSYTCIRTVCTSIVSQPYNEKYLIYLSINVVHMRTRGPLLKRKGKFTSSPSPLCKESRYTMTPRRKTMFSSAAWYYYSLLFPLKLLAHGDRYTRYAYICDARCASRRPSWPTNSDIECVAIQIRRPRETKVYRFIFRHFVAIKEQNTDFEYMGELLSKCRLQSLLA